MMDAATYHRRLAARFRQLAERPLASETPASRVLAAPDRLRKEAADTAARLPSDGLFPDAPAPAQLTARVRAAVDLAYAQAGQSGAELVVEALGHLDALRQRQPVLHGTGSWALAGLLRDGFLRAGGDGQTGEVAITGVVEPDLFVLHWLTPFSLYAAAAFAYMNADYQHEGLLVSATRAGQPYIGAFVAELLFGPEEGPFLGPGAQGLRTDLVRHRLPERDELFRQACKDVETALANVLFSVQLRMQSDPGLAELPVPDQFRAAVHRYAAEQRERLLGSVDGETPAARQAKEARLAELGQQYPVILLLDPDAIPGRPDPSYPWTDERRVAGRIDAKHITHLLAPSTQLESVRTQLEAAGRCPQVLPLEWFEALRLIAERF